MERGWTRGRVRRARVEEGTRQLTLKCIRITDQRADRVDRWIQVNRFTRPHVPRESEAAAVKWNQVI